MYKWKIEKFLTLSNATVVKIDKCQMFYKAIKVKIEEFVMFYDATVENRKVSNSLQCNCGKNRKVS